MPRTITAEMSRSSPVTHCEFVKDTVINIIVVICLRKIFVPARQEQSFSFAFLDHYGKVADKYDYYYWEIEEVQTAIAMEYLDLQSDHVVVDVGGGTGYSATKIFKIAGLKNPITCVDPSAEMLGKANGRKGVVLVLKTAEEFFDDVSLCRTLDRVLLKGCFHHLSEPGAVFKNMERSLRPNGLCLIVNVKTISCYMKFAEVTGIDVEYPAPDIIQMTCKLLEEANFGVETLLVESSVSLKKAKFYDMLRGRFMSSLYSLTEKQIEKGIEILEQGEFGRIESNGEIESILKSVVIKATKS